ncbi:unnamed protein product, partial [Didymodactylos carnosus]
MTIKTSIMSRRDQYTDYHTSRYTQNTLYNNDNNDYNHHHSYHSRPLPPQTSDAYRQHYSSTPSPDIHSSSLTSPHQQRNDSNGSVSKKHKKSKKSHRSDKSKNREHDRHSSSSKNVRKKHNNEGKLVDSQSPVTPSKKANKRKISEGKSSTRTCDTYRYRTTSNSPSKRSSKKKKHNSPIQASFSASHRHHYSSSSHHSQHRSSKNHHHKERDRSKHSYRHGSTSSNDSSNGYETNGGNGNNAIASHNTSIEKSSYASNATLGAELQKIKNKTTPTTINRKSTTSANTINTATTLLQSIKSTTEVVTDESDLPISALSRQQRINSNTDKLDSSNSFIQSPTLEQQQTYVNSTKINTTNQILNDDSSKKNHKQRLTSSCLLNLPLPSVDKNADNRSSTDTLLTQQRKTQNSLSRSSRQTTLTRLPMPPDYNLNVANDSLSPPSPENSSSPFSLLNQSNWSGTTPLSATVKTANIDQTTRRPLILQRREEMRKDQWGDRNVDMYEILAKIGEGTYGEV